MSITTLTELQTALTDRLARSDFTTSVQNECIALAEAEMQRVLKATDMELTMTYMVGDEYVGSPQDLLEVRSFYLNTSPKTPLLQMPSGLQTQTYGAGTDRPQFYELIGGKFRFAPVPDADYAATLVYLAKFTPLSTSVTTNWLLTKNPDAYLYGSLKHAGIRLQDPNMTQGYDSLFQSALMNINSQANRARWSGPGLTVRAG